MKRDPFPLQWPDGWKRTNPHLRVRSRFGKSGQVPFSSARTALLINAALAEAEQELNPR